MKLTIMFKTMLLPSILIVWGTTAPCWAVAEAAPPADLAMTSSQPIPSVVPKPEGLTMSEYLQKRLESHPQSQVHQRHTLLTPRELALDFINWSKDSDESASRTRETLQAPTNPTTPAFPTYKIPSTTIAPPPPTPKRPLSHAIYSSSLDAMAMNKLAQASSSRNVFSRRRYTEIPFHLGPDSNKWTPVTSSDTKTTSRNRGGAHRNHDFSFEGGGGGLDPRLMNKKPAYTQTDSFRQKDAYAEPKLQPFGNEEVTKRRPRLTTTLKPNSGYSRRNKQNRFSNPHNINSEKFESRDKIHDLSPLFKSDEHTGHIPHASPELRWPDGSLFDDKSKSKFFQNLTPTFKVSELHESSEKQNDDHNNYSFLGSPEVVDYYRNNEKEGIKSTHIPSPKIQFSFEVDPPVSKELPKYTYIMRDAHNSKNGHNEDTKYLNKSKEITIQSPGKKLREEDPNNYEAKSGETGPYRYKTSFAVKSKENESYLASTTESPHHSYDKIIKSNEEITKFVENKSYDTPIYRPKTNIKTNHYRFRLGPKSSRAHKHDESDTHKHDKSDNHKHNKSDNRKHDISESTETNWSSEKTNARLDELLKDPKSTNPNRSRGPTTTEKYYFELSPTESNEKHMSSKSHHDSSEDSRNLEEDGSPFDGYIVDDHFPKGHKSPQRDSAGYKDSSKSPEREFRPSYRYESQEMCTEKEPSKERPSQKSRPRSKWNETHKWSTEPSSRSKETTTQQPKGPKDRSRGSNTWSRESSKHSRESSKRSRGPASQRSKERKTSTEIIDEYAVHHIAGPPYHDSIPVDVVKTLEKEGGPSYIPKTAITHQDKDSYEVAVDKFIDDDDPFHFEEHSFNAPPHHETPVVYYEQDAHSARQSTERSLENATPRTIDIKTSSHFGDVIDDTPTITRRKPFTAGGDRTRVFDELVYEYDGEHPPEDNHNQNHRYDPESVIGSNDPFDFGKNIGRAISYFEQRDPFSERDSVRGIAHHNGQEPRLEVMNHENHFEEVTRHEPFGHQDVIAGVFHDSERFQHDPFSEDHMEGDPRQHQSDINQHDPFHYERHTEDITRREPDLSQHDYMRPRDNRVGRDQFLDHIDENTPPNFYKSSRRHPMDTNSGSTLVRHSSFHSLPVDELPAPRPQSSHDFSREQRFQVSYERSPPEKSRNSRRRLPTTTTTKPQRLRDRRTKPDFDLNRNLRDEPRYRNVPPNRSNDLAPLNRGQRDRSRFRERIPGNGPRDQVLVNSPRDRIPANGPRDRRSRGRSRDEIRARERDGRNQEPNEQQWNFQDLVSLGFPNNIGQLFG